MGEHTGRIMEAKYKSRDPDMTTEENEKKKILMTIFIGLYIPLFQILEEDLA